MSEDKNKEPKIEFESDKSHTKPEKNNEPKDNKKNSGLYLNGKKNVGMYHGGKKIKSIYLDGHRIDF